MAMSVRGSMLSHLFSDCMVAMVPGPEGHADLSVAAAEASSDAPACPTAATTDASSDHPAEPGQASSDRPVEPPTPPSVDGEQACGVQPAGPAAAVPDEPRASVIPQERQFSVLGQTWQMEFGRPRARFGPLNPVVMQVRFLMEWRLHGMGTTMGQLQLQLGSTGDLLVAF